MGIFKKFKELIILGKYYEAHEVFEKYWHTIRKTSHPYKNVYRGFINAAVSLELKKRGKNNYKKVWNSYEKYRYLYYFHEEFKKLMCFLDKKKAFFVFKQLTLLNK